MRIGGGRTAAGNGVRGHLLSEILASAPGKLVVLGEYAVLEGAPALAVAVTRRARVCLRSHGNGELRISAPALGIANLGATLGADGRLCWLPGDSSAARLALVEQVWAELAAVDCVPAAGQGCELELDSSGFFSVAERSRSKLGLGSSAALTVALGGALASFAGRAALLEDRAAWLLRLRRAHRRWQGEAGSGVDLAASLYGGFIRYQRPTADATAVVSVRSWPPAGVHYCFVWSGEAVSTADSLRRLAEWRRSRPAAYRARTRELCALAQQADARADGSAGEFIALVAEYGAALARFTAAARLHAESPAQRALAQLAARSGAAYKPCGAGGDIGLLVAETAECLEMLQRGIIAAGLQPVALAIDPLGLQVETAPMAGACRPAATSI